MPSEYVAEIGERPGEDTADVLDIVTGLHQVLQGPHHRQPGPYRRFVQKMGIGVAAARLEPAVIIHRTAAGAFVWRNDMNAALQPFGVSIRNPRIGGAVDQNRVRQVLRLNVIDKPGQIRRRTALQRRTPVPKIDAPVVQHHAPATAHCANAQVEIEISRAVASLHPPSGPAGRCRPNPARSGRWRRSLPKGKSSHAPFVAHASYRPLRSPPKCFVRRRPGR